MITVEEIRETFEDIELNGSTIRELLDFNNTTLYKLLDTTKQVEYLQEKIKLETSLTPDELDNNFDIQRIDGFDFDLHLGVDKQAVQKVLNTIFYDSAKKQYYNTEKRTHFPIDVLWISVRKSIIGTLDYSLVNYHGEYWDRGNKLRSASKRYEKLFDAELNAYILTENSFSTLNLLQSPWVENQQTELDSGTLTVTDPLKLKDINIEESENYKENTESWEDYANFNEELNWITASRFASSRRKCFLWQRCEAGWGKTFKAGIYTRLGISMPMKTFQLKRIIEGEVTGVMAKDVYDKWILFFDEFNFAGAALKEANESLVINQKHLPSSEVQVYVKMFASAEDVTSLTQDGMEDQFKDRFLLQKKYGKLEDVEHFIKEPDEFTSDLTLYAYRRINEKIKEYQSMGEKEATTQANKFVFEMHTKYKDTSPSIEEIYKEHNRNLKELIVKAFRDDPDNTERKLEPKLQKVRNLLHNDKGIIYVQNPTLCEQYVKDWFAVGDSLKRSKYKNLSEITDLPSSKDTKKNLTIRDGMGNVIRQEAARWFDLSDHIHIHVDVDVDAEYPTEEIDSWSMSSTTPYKPYKPYKPSKPSKPSLTKEQIAQEEKELDDLLNGITKEVEAMSEKSDKLA